MLRRVSISAALGALTVPVALAGPAHAEPGGTSNNEPATHATVGTHVAATAARKPAPGRAARAARARSEDDAPLSVSIDQLSPSTIPQKGLVRVSGFVTNNDTQTWSAINAYAFISATPLTSPAQLAEAAALPPDAVVGGRIADEHHKDTI